RRRLREFRFRGTHGGLLRLVLGARGESTLEQIAEPRFFAARTVEVRLRRRHGAARGVDAELRVGLVQLRERLPFLHGRADIDVATHDLARDLEAEIGLETRADL